MTREPTFMFCVGATKAGTSWLHDHLARHDECHFRTIKELHYFGLSKRAHFENAARLGHQKIARLTELLPTAEHKSESIERRLVDLRDWQKVLELGAADMPAYTSYLTTGIGSAHVVGDVTPAYGLLPLETLRSMSHVGLDVRVVYLVRDPLARLWSHVRMIVKHAAPEKFRAEAAALFDSVISGQTSKEITCILSRGDYASILPKLIKAFGPKRLLVMFYEDLISLAGTAKLSEFLGILPGKADLSRRIHNGLHLALPPVSKDRALAFLQPQYDYIVQHMGPVPKAWHYNMKEGIA